MNTTIRRAAPGDEQALAELNAFVHDFHVANYPSHFRAVSLDEVAAGFRRLVDNAETRIWIADEGQTLVGYVSVFLHERAETPFTFSRRWYEIDQMAVRPDRRRMGIGRVLVEHVFADAREEGIKEVELTCWELNADAREAYQSLGFEKKFTRFWRKSGVDTPMRGF